MKKPSTLVIILALSFVDPVFADVQQEYDSAIAPDSATSLKKGGGGVHADQGNPDAQYNLGLMYNYGQGVIRDYKIAIKWYTLAADQGHAEAQFNLGLMHQSGQGMIPDVKASIKWYTLAADPPVSG